MNRLDYCSLRNPRLLVITLGTAAVLSACDEASMAPELQEVASMAMEPSRSKNSAQSVSSLSHASATVQVGSQLLLTAYDKGGNVLTVRWSTSNSSVASVSSSGLVTGKGIGTASISAQTKGTAVSASITVVSPQSSAPVVAAVIASPEQVSLEVGATVKLSAVVKDSHDNPLNGRAIAWKSSNASVATVDDAGAVLGVAAGSASITAVVDGVADTAYVLVNAPASVVRLFGRTQRPYTADSPWNTPIPVGAAVDASSGAMVATILASSNGKLRSDPTQYAYPVYFADASTPRATVICTGYISVNHPDGTREGIPTKQLENVPIPPEAVPSQGSDGQIIVIDTETGTEYDIWRFAPPGGCENMTKYVGGVYRSGVETSYTSRGAGVPYLAGLIRPWEIARGRIDHALAFGYPLIRQGRCVWPASKTDGQTDRADAIPEGARLQLDPSLDVDRIEGLSPVGRIIARALQNYGAIVIDVSGSNKIYAEDDVTASWGTQLVATTVSAIPVQHLRVLQLPQGYWASTYAPNHGRCVR